MVTLIEAEYLIKLVRKSITNYLHNGKPANASDAPESLKKPLGTFVTLHAFKTHELRGCIGYPLPIMPLADAVADCAVKSAFEDPRFPPLSSEKELESFGCKTVTVSLESRPVFCRFELDTLRVNALREAGSVGPKNTEFWESEKGQDLLRRITAETPSMVKVTVLTPFDPLLPEGIFDLLGIPRMRSAE